MVNGQKNNKQLIIKNMEEKKKKASAKEENKEITPLMNEQYLQGLQAAVQQANVRLQQLMEQNRQLEQFLRDKTVDQMFKVLEYMSYFDSDFVTKCADTITTYISNVAFSSGEEQAQEPETKEDAQKD